MKNKLNIVFILLMVILAFTSCRKWEEHYIHRCAGAWEVQRLEIFDLDSVTNEFISVAVFENPGFIELYDNKSDKYNYCYYSFNSGVQYHAFYCLETSCNVKNHCWWIKDDKMRWDIWEVDGGLAERHLFFTINEMSKDKQEWTYYTSSDYYGLSKNTQNITIKEVYTVERKSH